MTDMTREEAIKIIDIQLHGTPKEVDYYSSYMHASAMKFAISDMKKIEKYEQTMEKILAEINTPNRGTCDYYIIDQIENIINGLRKEVL